MQSASAGMQLPSPGSRRQSGFHAVARAALANDGQLRLNVSAGGGGAAGKHTDQNGQAAAAAVLAEGSSHNFPDFWLQQEPLA